MTNANDLLYLSENDVFVVFLDKFQAVLSEVERHFEYVK